MSGVNRPVAREPRWTFGKLIIRLASWVPASLLALLTANNLYERLPPDTQFLPLIRLLILIVSWIAYCLILGWSKRLMPFALMMSLALMQALIHNWQFDATKALIILGALAVTLVLIRQLPLWLMTLAMLISSVLTFALSVAEPVSAAFNYREAALTWAVSLIVCWLAASVPLEVFHRLMKAGIPDPV